MTKDPIIFYCKDCEAIVDTSRIGRQYVYKCKKCGTKNVAFGTEKSIRSFFRIEEREKKEEIQKKRKEREAKSNGKEVRKVGLKAKEEAK
ncbi:MAG: hypothetical protein V1679_00330 [Candidatus Peregrinibacteria bacterium]